MFFAIDDSGDRDNVLGQCAIMIVERKQFCCLRLTGPPAICKVFLIGHYWYHFPDNPVMWDHSSDWLIARYALLIPVAWHGGSVKRVRTGKQLKETRMSRDPSRPLSPHLQIWKWGPNMLVSILHRMTGFGLAIFGGIIFAWWLLAAASGEQSYAAFMDMLTVESGAINIVGAVLGIGLSWAFFTHLANGIRHFVLDTGAGYELDTNRRGSIAVVFFGLAATLALWVWLLWPFLLSLAGGTS
jgi:succinate dehydrogenase / fumarate reductase cytochrome b subunit